MSVSIGSSLNGICVRDVISIESPSLLCPWDSPGKGTGVGGHAVLQGIFPTQGWNPGLLHYRWILYHLSHQGRPSNKLKCLSLSRVRVFATPWTVAHQAPPSVGFSRQQYWSGLPCPPPGDLPDPGIEPRSPADSLHRCSFYGEIKKQKLLIWKDCLLKHEARTGAGGGGCGQEDWSIFKEEVPKRRWGRFKGRVGCCRESLRPPPSCVLARMDKCLGTPGSSVVSFFPACPRCPGNRTKTRQGLREGT